MLTVKQIIKETPANIMKRSFEVQVKPMKSMLWLNKEPDTPEAYNEFIIKTSRPGIQHKIHNNIIRVFRRDRVWVTCDCDFFKYNCEFSLNRSGSTDILHSNGSMPKIKNPFLRNLACIHIISCFMYLQRKGLIST